MRLDHIAYRVQDRHATSKQLSELFGYSVGVEFDIQFDDGSVADCIAMVPPEKDNGLATLMPIPWTRMAAGIERPLEYHLAPEIFISDGTEDSIVGSWVRERGGIGGIHHMAYQVNDIQETVRRWRSSGIKFLSEEVIDCPEDNLRQIFTKPLDVVGGIIFELIERGEKGFCQNAVKDLMNSTKEV
jgi:catechol 2,3-dioxygenase-like lactoylglutathione lyase family enzyme